MGQEENEKKTKKEKKGTKVSVGRVDTLTHYLRTPVHKRSLIANYNELPESHAAQ